VCALCDLRDDRDPNEDFHEPKDRSEMLLTASCKNDPDGSQCHVYNPGKENKQRQEDQAIPIKGSYAFHISNPKDESSNQFISDCAL
jgi:hypothetical protein